MKKNNEEESNFFLVFLFLNVMGKAKSSRKALFEHTCNIKPKRMTQKLQ